MERGEDGKEMVRQWGGGTARGGQRRRRKEGNAKGWKRARSKRGKPKKMNSKNCQPSPAFQCATGQANRALRFASHWAPL